MGGGRYFKKMGEVATFPNLGWLQYLSEGKNVGSILRGRKKWGEDTFAAEGRGIMSIPPSGCFWHLTLNIICAREYCIRISNCNLYLAKCFKNAPAPFYTKGICSNTFGTTLGLSKMS